MYLKTRTPEFVDIARTIGLSFVRIDLQHGLDSLDQGIAMIEAVKSRHLAAGVRLDKDPAIIERVLAAGVDSVTLPGVETPDEAATLVNWCGESGAVVSMQIESGPGLLNVAAIAAVPGVDVLHCGRSDLTRSLGLAGDPDRIARVDAAEDAVLEAAAAAGKRGAMHWPPGSGDAARLHRWVTRGLAWVTLGSDTQILRHALGQRLAEASRTHD